LTTGLKKRAAEISIEKTKKSLESIELIEKVICGRK
jgi:hypothetical protein